MKKLTNLKKIDSEYSEQPVKSALQWLEKNKNNGLRDDQLTDVVRALIESHNKMVEEITLILGMMEQFGIPVRVNKESKGGNDG